MRHAFLLPLIFMLQALGGCAASPDTPRASPSATIDVINLYALPAAINWDNNPGADGLRVSVNAFRLDQPRAVAIDAGWLELRLYEGRLARGQLTDAEPFHAWSFTAAELRPRLLSAAAGPTYMLALAWDTHVPSSSVITLIARYHPPAGQPLDSAPLSIAMKN